jgi:TrmH family RNA methyltransferase
MTNKIIDTKHNATYKYFKKIATKKGFRKEKNKTILIGPHLINTFLQAKKDIECFIRDEKIDSPEINEIVKLNPNIEIYDLKHGLFLELADLKSSNGLIALINTPVEKTQK